MKIYTKTGDQGSTSLFGGERVQKNNDLIEAYGTSDELNSSVGLIVTHLPAELESLRPQLLSVQHQLFNLGSHLACGDEKIRAKLPELETADIKNLETWIDSMQTELPDLTQFILPGGTPAASHTHLARTICRRFERQLVNLTTFPGLEFILQYTNRLSDTLFVCARYINFKSNQNDIVWKK